MNMLNCPCEYFAKLSDKLSSPLSTCLHDVICKIEKY